MKKKKQIFDKDFKMPNIFRDDLENIEDVIKQELKPQEYKLESESFEYTGMSEIKNELKQIGQFRIQSYSPDMFIEFTPKKAFIHADDDSVNTIGSIKKIMDIIEKRERKFLWYYSNIGVLLMLPTMTLSILSLISLHLTDKIYEIVILLSSIIWVVTGLYIAEYQFSRINFIHKENETDFFHRNKDQIVLILFGSIIGAVITVSFQKLFK